MSYINLNSDNIENEHICCAISDKKCREGYELKKQWLGREFSNGHSFRRLDERAKVFMEYSPAETAWVPVTAPDYIMIGCFWVSGKYKGHGHGKALLKQAVEEGTQQGKAGLATVVGKKKFHFMSDTKWLLKQGFIECDSNEAGFSLLYLPLRDDAVPPRFNESAKTGECPDKEGYVVYYSNRCPFTEFHIKESLTVTGKKRNIKFKVIKLETLKQAQNSPTPATIFSLFSQGKFITTDLSVCMDSRFDKIVNK